MAIEQRPGTETAEGGHLVGSPLVDAEWSRGDDEQLPHSMTLEGNPHGKMSSWVVVVTAVVAFAVAGVALIFHAWVVVWICVAVMVLMIPAGIAVRIMEDTVGWAQPTPGQITRGDMTRTATKVRKEELRYRDELQRRDAQASGHQQHARR